MKAIFIIDNNLIKIKQATTQGWIGIQIDDLPAIADLSFPTSTVRRGRVQEGGGVSPTITTTGGLYVFENIGD